MDFLNDTNFWVGVSFVIFAGVFLKYGRRSALDFLDNKINAIKAELNQAENLRIEAQELLAEYQLKHKDAMKEAQTIIADAKKYAEQIRKQSEAEATKTAARREIQLKEKLERIEQKAKQDIESYTAQIAINAARDLLISNMDAKADKAIIHGTLDSVSKALN